MFVLEWELVLDNARESLLQVEPLFVPIGSEGGTCRPVLSPGGV